jgi:glycine cleavage system H protein
MAIFGKYEFPEELFYDRTEHLWLRREGGEATLGLDSLAIDMVGELVHLDLAPEGARLVKGDLLGTVEAEKMVRPLKSPLAGTVTAQNEEALARPLCVGADPYAKGWLLRIRPESWDADSADLVTGERALSLWVEAEIALLKAGEK